MCYKYHNMFFSKLAKFRYNNQYRYLGHMIIPPGNSGSGGHLSSANNANKLIKPNLKHLAPVTNIYNTDSKLYVSHTACKITSNKYLFNISLNVTSNIVKPATYVACLDVSSSMDGASTYNDSDPECSKFSRWDLVKHSVNTIIHCLRPVDKLVIVTFSDNARKILPLTNMDENGKRIALTALNSISPGGMTNLWDGLDISLQEMDNISNDSNSFTLLFTDGEPNVNPVRGIMNEFLIRNLKYPLKTTVHTFGYGYQLDSVLLRDIAEKSGSLFGHIPDHTMNNSVFINFLSNSLATAINKVDMKILPNDLNIMCLSHPTHRNNLINIGAIQSGQPQNIILGGIIDNPLDFKLDLNIKYNGITIPYTIDNFTKNNNTNTSLSTIILDKGYGNTDEITDSQIKHILASGDFAYQIPKMWLTSIIKNGMENYDLQRTIYELDKLYNVIETMLSYSDNKTDKEKFVALLKNIKSNETIEGQVYKAFSSDEWYKRWGHIYLKYFVRSHQLQVCSNFKDTSLQHYGGQLFREIKTEVEDIFSTIPVPKPSRSSTSFTGNFQQSFYKPSGPCVDGFGQVKMANGSTILVKDLVKGDLVSSDGRTASIVCIIKTKIKSGHVDMLSLNGMKVTPWHPVRINNKWDFPANIGTLIPVNCDYVYNFVLNEHHVMHIGGTDIITLGHGISNDPILKHPFFGTNKVIDHLKTHPGWADGLIEMDEYKPSYDNNGMISSFW